ncbi:MAG: gamma-glutamyltranspeptidase/glutathione hydrolase, partial [Polyangiales bacterium]
SQVGGLASGVPGEPAGIAAMVDRFGSMPLSAIVAPAERYARNGVPVSEGASRMSGAFGDQMKRDPVMRRWFAPGADAMAVGSTLRQPELARTLAAFGVGGHDAIYRGSIARAIAAANRRNGGIMTAQDLADYSVVEREPLIAERFGHRWATAPPPSAGGFTLLQSLGVLERLPARWRQVSDEGGYFHALAESWKGPFIDRQRYFGDPDHVTLPLDAMRAPERLDRLAAAFHPALAMPAGDYDLPLEGLPSSVDQPEDHGTSHLCVVDSEGNIAAVTTTVNLPFGARYTAAGIVMNDEMDDFAREVGEMNAFGLVGGAPNLPGPGKRPISSMSPTIIFRGDRPVLCLGAAGGSRIITATQQVAMNHIVRGMNAADAISAPRIHHQGRPGELRSETFAPLPADVLQSLLERGHQHDPIHNVASVQSIHIHEDGHLSAACDPRKGGRPAGQ